jgi:hypothetical protein
MTGPLSALLSGKLPPGLYRLDMSRRSAALCIAVERHGWRCFLIDGAAVYDKQTFLDEAARAMRFPPYFGRNWDAFEECITDLSWAEAPGYVLIYDHASILVAQHPEAWNVAYAIMADAVQTWQNQSRPFYVLLRNAGRIPQTLHCIENGIENGIDAKKHPDPADTGMEPGNT